MDCINWLLLQEANKSGLFLSPLAINRFEGEPSIVANVYDINPPFPPNQDLKQYYDVMHSLLIHNENHTCLLLIVHLLCLEAYIILIFERALFQKN